jgi:hypothetical protein
VAVKVRGVASYYEFYLVDMNRGLGCRGWAV